MSRSEYVYISDTAEDSVSTLTCRLRPLDINSFFDIPEFCENPA